MSIPSVTISQRPDGRYDGEIEGVVAAAAGEMTPNGAYDEAIRKWEEAQRPPSSALILTNEEWDALKEICGYYLGHAAWLEGDSAARAFPNFVARLRLAEKLEKLI